jgi:hypothetical protein
MYEQPFTVRLVLRAEDPDDLPSGERLRNALQDGLPDEWFEETDGDFMLHEIGQPTAHEVRAIPDEIHMGISAVATIAYHTMTRPTYQQVADHIRLALAKHQAKPGPMGEGEWKILQLDLK